MNQLASNSVSLALLAVATACGTSDYVTSETLTYDSTIGYHGTFDLHEPLNDSVRTNRPAILAIHGGAWRGGDKVWGQNFAAELCPYGYVVFSINYRLAGRPNSTWPAQIEDVQKALRYIRANAARFRIDPERIASLGMSAGGHLATMVALRGDSADRVRVAVNLDGEHDMTMPAHLVMDDFAEIMSTVFGHRPPWPDSALRDISTVSFVRPDVAILTVHGEHDDNVYVTQGEQLTSRLKAVGAETEFIRIEGRDGNCHEDCWKVPRARVALHRFLDRKLLHDGESFYRQAHGPNPSRN